MEDSTPIQETVQEDVTPSEGTQIGRSAGWRLSAGHDALLPVSFVGGLLGMLAGTLPAALWVLLFGVSFAPTYVLLPLLIFLGIRVMRGCRDKRGFIVACTLSAVGLYLTFLSCQASRDIIRFKMRATSLPLVTAKLIGSGEPFAEPLLSSAYLYPVLFTFLGVLLVHELMRPRPEKQNNRTDSDANTPGLTS